MKYILLVSGCLALSGCAVSLHPFYTQNSIVDDRSIEGRWTDGETTWQVTRTATGTVEIATCEHDSCQADMIGVLFETGGVTFLDFAEKPVSRLGTAIHPHGLFEVRIRAGEIDLTMLDSERIAKLAERQLLDIEFTDLPTGILLTAKPENLQRFVLRHMTDGQIFGDSVHLSRPLAGE